MAMLTIYVGQFFSLKRIHFLPSKSLAIMMINLINFLNIISLLHKHCNYSFMVCRVFFSSYDVDRRRFSPEDFETTTAEFGSCVDGVRRCCKIKQ